MKKSKLFRLLWMTSMFLLLSMPAFAQDEEDEGPEAPPAPIEDWIPAMAGLGVAYAAYVVSKNKKAVA